LLNVYVVSGQVLYTAVWRPSTEGEIQVYGWKYEDYRARYDELWNQGWRLKLLNVYVVSGQVLYTAVWRPSTEGEIQVYGWKYEDYRAKYDELWNHGWRLQALLVQSTPFYAPFDVVWESVDPNGIPLNPQWAWRLTHLEPQDRSLPDPTKLCEAFRSVPGTGTVSRGTPPCTTQPLKFDSSGPSPKFWSGFACAFGAPSDSYHGHVNWQAVTYNGAIYWGGHSNSVYDDDDYELRFQAFLLSRFQSRHSRLMHALIKSCHVLLLAATAALVWIEHQVVFRSGGRTFRRFWNETWQEFTLLYHTSSAKG
jgi:hypothetical protein